MAQKEQRLAMGIAKLHKYSLLLEIGQSNNLPTTYETSLLWPGLHNEDLLQ